MVSLPLAQNPAPASTGHQSHWKSDLSCVWRLSSHREKQQGKSMVKVENAPFVFSSVA